MQTAVSVRDSYGVAQMCWRPVLCVQLARLVNRKAGGGSCSAVTRSRGGDKRIVWFASRKAVSSADVLVVVAMRFVGRCQAVASLSFLKHVDQLLIYIC